MVESIDFEFGQFVAARSLFGPVLRTAMYDEWVKEFIKAHPTGTVVELGTGLNTRFERLDNGRIHWFDLDLPDAIALRKRFFVDTERRKMISGSVVDDTWLQIVRQSPGPYFLVAEAVLMYLEENQVRAALGGIARAFPGARLAFDTKSAWAVQNHGKLDVMKQMTARSQWACDRPQELEAWGLGVRLIESRTFAQAQAPLRWWMPFRLRVFGSLLQRRAVNGYRLNLFEIDQRPQEEPRAHVESRERT
jgi:O-methyltransferase involved in polyketide biosynthesis